MVAATAKKIIEEANAIPSYEYKNNNNKTKVRRALFQINTSDNYCYNHLRYDLENLEFIDDAFVCIVDRKDGSKHYVNLEMINTIIVNPDPKNNPMNTAFYAR